MTATPSAGGPWTCPFCPLACDDLSVIARPGSAAPALAGGACERAERALAASAAPGAPIAFVDGRAVDLESAIAAASQRLAAARQPLFAGLGTDVEGARALYPLVCATGAMADAAGGDAFFEGLRALQDRGQFTTTLAEVRTRADLVVFVGALPLAAAPRLRERLGLADPGGMARHLVLLGGDAAAASALAGWTTSNIGTQSIGTEADPFDLMQTLAALVDGRLDAAAHPALAVLATRLRAARYAVLVGAPPALPRHGGLVIEAVHRIVHRLNRSTRAAALWIGGGQGAATANQVFAWLGGLPLRSRAGPRGLEHAPQAFATARVLTDGAADLLFWVSAFEANAVPPPTALPLVALAHPAQAEACRRAGSVFIGVSTPGLGSTGHLFRTDGTVLMPLDRARADGLPTVAEVARALSARLPAREAA